MAPPQGGRTVVEYKFIVLKMACFALLGAMTSLFVVLLQTIRRGCPPRPSEA